MTANPPAGADPALAIHDLRKTYDTGVQALKGISLEVRQAISTHCLAPMAPARAP